MIISTSSHNVLLTDHICEYVENCMSKAFGQLADDVVSVDTRLEAVNDDRGRGELKAHVRVDLRNRRHLVTEIRDDNLYTAVRRAANDSAANI